MKRIEPVEKSTSRPAPAQINVKLSPAKKRAFRIACISHNVCMQAYLTASIDRMLDFYEGRLDKNESPIWSGLVLRARARGEQ